jgi:sortase A
MGSAWGRASSGLFLPPPPGPAAQTPPPEGVLRRLRARALRAGGRASEWHGYADRRRGPADRRRQPRESDQQGRRGAHAGASGAHGRRGRVARSLHWLSVALVGLGILALADALVTMVWQEPFTALYTTIEQEGLNASLRRLDRAAPSQAIAARLALIRRVDQRIALLAESLERSAPNGSAVGQISIPRIGASYALVKGTGTAELEKGPGVYSRTSYPQTAFPGIPGVTAIAGHRTTFLAPFRHIDALRPGDHITITMPYASFGYTVVRARIVPPGDVHAAVDPGPGTQLVLSSCNPPFSAAQRILVDARLASTTPLGAARSYEEAQALAPLRSQLGSQLGLGEGLTMRARTL